MTSERRSARRSMPLVALFAALVASRAGVGAGSPLSALADSSDSSDEEETQAKQ